MRFASTIRAVLQPLVRSRRRYQISGTRLTRSINSGAAILLIPNLASPSLFTYEPSTANAKVVTILLQATPKNSPNTTVQLTSEVRLRNPSPS